MRMYDVKDDINKQRMEIWKAGNISNENAMADFIEKELKSSEEEAIALEEEIQRIQGLPDTQTETPIRRNRRPIS
jgi:hypothetical protein